MTAAGHDDPVVRVDALVAGIAPGLDAPAVNRREMVLVTGPWLAGVTAVAVALRQRLPQYKFVESTDLGPGDAPTAVVFVVSAAVPLTESDCTMLDSAAENTDVVVGVVSKIDLHRAWRDVLAGNREKLAAHAPRYAEVPWVGAAASPEVGEQRIDDVVAVVSAQLAKSDLARRNRLRAWESRLQTVTRRFARDAEGAGRRARVDALREERNGALRQRRQSKSERTIALRGQIQQARAQLSFSARDRCSALRGKLQDDIRNLSRRMLPEFETHTRGRVDAVVVQVAEATDTNLADVAQTLGVPVTPPGVDELPVVEYGPPPLKSRSLETKLMALLGAGFGLGVALTLSRLVAGVAPRLNPLIAIVAAVACVAVGLAVTVWVVRVRGLLHDRAVLDRWTGDVTSSLRSVVELLVATRVLVVESALTTELGARDEAENVLVSDQVSAIDNELREHAVAAARAAALRDREMPAVQAALDAVRAELGEPDTRDPDGLESVQGPIDPAEPGESEDSAGRSGEPG